MGRFFLKYVGESHKIVHISTWTFIQSARAFFESLRLVEIREHAGVIAPEFIYLDLLEEGDL